MTEYLVRWEITLDADTHADAAREALRIQRDPDSIAQVFDVLEMGLSTSPIVTVDLYEETA